jgi:endonuclease/exonuclease/phosphatase family metal-dependent hydrolase
VRIATWNMCDVRQWNCRDTGSSRQKVEVLKQLATVDGARVLLLQEVCARELDAARKELGKEWHSTFRAYASRDSQGLSTTVRCAGRHQGAAGLAILASSPPSHVSVVPSQQPDVGLHRGIICATVGPYNLRVCNAHLSLPGGDRVRPDREYRDDQLKSLADAANSRTVFGGDLNSAPPWSDNEDSWIWPHETYRTYRECDQESATSQNGRATHRTGHKVDYLFTALPRTQCLVRGTEASDHLALIMQVSIGE